MQLSSCSCNLNFILGGHETENDDLHKPLRHIINSQFDAIVMTSWINAQYSFVKPTMSCDSLKIYARKLSNAYLIVTVRAFLALHCGHLTIARLRVYVSHDAELSDASGLNIAHNNLLPSFSNSLPLRKESQRRVVTFVNKCLHLISD